MNNLILFCTFCFLLPSLDAFLPCKIPKSTPIDEKFVTDLTRLYLKFGMKMLIFFFSILADYK